jgi:hypothetical protein
MPAADREAAVVLWVDAPSADGAGSAHSPRGSSASDRVLALLDARELPVTWTIDDFSVARPLLDRLAVESTHEVAIRLNSHGSPAGTRNAQVKQMSKQLAAGAREGCAVSALVLSGTLSVEMAATVRRAGVRSIRVERAALPEKAGWRAWFPRLTRRPMDRAPRPRTPQRHGLWEMTVGTQLLVAGQSSRRSLATVSRAIERAASDRDVCHAVLGLEHCDRLAKRDWRRIESLLDEIADRRSSTGLCVLTAAQLATRYAEATRGMPARSILRRAA